SLDPAARELSSSQLASLSVPVARHLLEPWEPPADGAVEPVPAAGLPAARLAATWLGRRGEGTPGDEGAPTLRERARAVLADGHADVAAAHIRRQEFEGARRFVQQAVDSGELPGARGETLLEELGASVRREVDRLTAAAVRGSKDERD